MRTNTFLEPCLLTIEEVKQLLHESEKRFDAGIYVTEEEMEEVWNAPLI